MTLKVVAQSLPIETKVDGVSASRGNSRHSRYCGCWHYQSRDNCSKIGEFRPKPQFVKSILRKEKKPN